MSFPMRVRYLTLFFFSSLLSVALFTVNVFAAFVDTVVVILPGVFYFTVHGDLQDGVSLSGLQAESSTVYQEGYWQGAKGGDYLEYFDSSSVEGFRIQMSLSGDFEYLGSDLTQADIPASNFTVFGEYNTGTGLGESPDIGEDDLSKTLSIDTAKSCKYSPSTPYRDYFYFDSRFMLPDYVISFTTEPFNYLVSRNACRNEGILNLGRFNLEMGYVKAGEYKASLFVIMLDGY